MPYHGCKYITFQPWRGRMESRHLGGSPRSPFTALRRMAKQSFCLRLNAQRFCRARPQGRALAKRLAKRFQKRRGHRHGARKVGASTCLSHPMACERIVLRAYLSHAIASPLTMKVSAILANLSLTAPVAGSLCGSAWPVAGQFTNLGARTGRARQNCCAQA